jgi:hypothetical protein
MVIKRSPEPGVDSGLSSEVILSAHSFDRNASACMLLL